MIPQSTKLRKEMGGTNLSVDESVVINLAHPLFVFDFSLEQVRLTLIRINGEVETKAFAQL